MLRKILSIVALLMMITAARFSSNVEAATKEILRSYFPPILMYHDIKLVPLNNFDVTLKDFRAQMKWLSNNRYQTMTMDEFVDCVENNKGFPHRAVVITFDDGYQGAYLYAAAELKRLDMKATFFINPKLLDTAIEGYPYMKTSEVKELAESPLFSIESHSMTHVHLDQIDAETRRYELIKSKEFVEQLTGKSVRAIAYPYGDYDKAVIDDVKAAGYAVAFAVQDRGLFDDYARFSIPRIYVGLALSHDRQKLFKKYVNDYKKMPPEAFEERWSPLY